MLWTVILSVCIASTIKGNKSIINILRKSVPSCLCNLSHHRLVFLSIRIWKLKECNLEMQTHHLSFMASTWQICNDTTWWASQNTSRITCSPWNIGWTLSGSSWFLTLFYAFIFYTCIKDIYTTSFFLHKNTAFFISLHYL